MSARYSIKLEFLLDEPVSVGHLAQRVAEACAAYGALRPGEAVAVERYVYTITDEPRPNPFD